MNLTKLIPVIAILFCVSSFAQERPQRKMIDSGTVEQQFDYLIKKSNRYQDYKVVRQTWLNQLKKSVNDSLNLIKKDLSDTKIVLIEKENKITSLTSTLDSTNNNVVILNKEKDSINFFGALISKPVYNTILWTIIGVLFVGLLFYIFKFNRGNLITKETNDKFNELEREYEGHRQRSLEREQVLRRKLQDEINKQKEGK